MEMPAKRSGHRDTTSLAYRALERLCPNAPECRRKWHPLPDEDAALCGLCGQRLDRATLAALLAGRLA
jgi:hypothetical protein